eukprot:jgi/Galph1/2803/GphlegSOOS_G1454.1
MPNKRSSPRLLLKGDEGVLSKEGMETGFIVPFLGKVYKQTRDTSKQTPIVGSLVDIAYANLSKENMFLSVLLSLTSQFFKNYYFQETAVLVASQLSVTISILYICQRLGKISVAHFRWDMFLACAPLSLSYFLMLVTSMVGLRDTDLVMYNTLRRTTVFFVLVLETIVLKAKPSGGVILSVLVMLSGTLVASIFDSSFTLYGYVMVFFANLTTAVYLVLIRYTRERTQLDNFGILYYCSVSCLPLFLCIALLDGSFKRTLIRAPTYALSFWIFFLLACSFGFIINHSIYYNTTTNSALTQNISAQVKDLALLISSYYFFHQSQSSLWNYIGVATSFLGGLLYVAAKLVEMRRTIEELPSE